MRWLSKLKGLFSGTTADVAPDAPWWEKDAAEYARWARGPTYDVIVDDRSFLLGLDELYRTAMKEHERNELLRCARRVADALRIQAADVPIEGYYSEHPDLATYFGLMRALQAEPATRTAEVEALSEFRRLLEVTSSRIFGRPVFKTLEEEDPYLLPRARDPVSETLNSAATPNEWTVARVTTTASALAEKNDDYSLVGLACRARDSVVIAALRESVVLYAEIGRVTSAMGARPKYVWRVNPTLAAAAQRFIDAFNALFGPELPPAKAAFAHIFGRQQPHITGRCVRLGQTTDGPPAYYHWAVVQDRDGEYAVHEFWSPEIWTTERYRESQGAWGA
jgi:hypothetical protein